MQGTITDEGSRIAGSRVRIGKDAHAGRARLQNTSARFGYAAKVVPGNRSSRLGRPGRLASRRIRHVLSNEVCRIAGSARGRFRPKLGVAVLIAAATVTLPNRVDATCVGPRDCVASTCTGPYNASMPGLHNAVISQQSTGFTYNARLRYTQPPVTNSYDRGCVSSSPGYYIDSGRYYCMDEARFLYLDIGQYNLLGGQSYFGGQSCYPLWYDRSFRLWRITPERGMEAAMKSDADGLAFYRELAVLGEPVYLGSGVTVFVDNVCTFWQGQPATDRWCGWPIYANPGDYIDRYWYYCLDKGQYRYLDEGQYNLLGGLSYLLGHPCQSMWYDYHLRSWLVILEKIVSPPKKAGPEYVDFYGEFRIFGKLAQLGDILRAFVAGDDTEPICVGQFIVGVEGWYGDLRVFRDNSSTTAKDGALPGETITFGAWDKSAGRWYPTEILYGRPEWTYHEARIRVDVNAIPEPSTISFLGLGALAVVLRRSQKRRPVARTSAEPADLT